MRFDLRESEGYLPDLEVGGAGQELSCFIPDGVEWKQLNYGQGEGQVMINSCELGFYYGDDNTLSIVLHEGDMSLSEMEKLVFDVRNKVFGCRADRVSVKSMES